MGRPKTFDRDHVIAVAMRAYWERGHAAMSLNAVCQHAGVSKPPLYKAFGSEDGLKAAVLLVYYEMTLAPMLAMLEEDLPFDEALEALITYVLRDHAEHGMPNGCLFVDMCQSRGALGELAGAQVDLLQTQTRSAFEEWIRRGKSSDQFLGPVTPRTAALYIDAQIASIMTMQRQGVPMADISRLFRLALSVLK